MFLKTAVNQKCLCMNLTISVTVTTFFSRFKVIVIFKDFYFSQKYFLMDRTAELEVCIKNIIQSGEALPSASFWRSDDRSSEFIGRSDDRSSETV